MTSGSRDYARVGLARAIGTAAVFASRGPASATGVGAWDVCADAAARCVGGVAISSANDPAVRGKRRLTMAEVGLIVATIDK